MIRAAILLAFAACAIGRSFPPAIPLYASYLKAPNKPPVDPLHPIPSVGEPGTYLLSTAVRIPPLPPTVPRLFYPWAEPLQFSQIGDSGASFAVPVFSRSRSIFLAPTHSSYSAVHQAAAYLPSHAGSAPAVYPYHAPAYLPYQAALPPAVYPYAAVHHRQVVAPHPLLAATVYPYATVHQGTVLPSHSALATVVAPPPANVPTTVVTTPAVATPVVTMSHGSSVTSAVANKSTVVSKVSSGPSVTTTVFRAPGIDATTVQRSTGAATTLMHKTARSSGSASVPRKVVMHGYASALGAVHHVYPVHVPVAAAASPAVFLRHVNYVPYGYTVRY